MGARERGGAPAGSAGRAGRATSGAPSPDASRSSLRRHRVPAWWTDAKLGIMVHWTPASVPAFAPTDAEIGDLLSSDAPDALKDVPYAEWYENSLRFDDSRVARHHREVYDDRPYEVFARDFESGAES